MLLVEIFLSLFQITKHNLFTLHLFNLCRRQPIRWWGISQADRTGWAHALHEPKGSVSRKCADGKLVCVAEKGAGAPAALQDLRAGKGSNL